MAELHVDLAELHGGRRAGARPRWSGPQFRRSGVVVKEKEKEKEYF
jgi:hypothetical protein